MPSAILWHVNWQLVNWYVEGVQCIYCEGQVAVNVQQHSCECVNVGEMNDFILVLLWMCFCMYLVPLLNEVCCMLYLLGIWWKEIWVHVLCLLLNNIQPNIQLEMLACSHISACSLQGILSGMEYALVIYRLECFIRQSVDDGHCSHVRSLFAHCQELHVCVCKGADTPNWTR